MKKVHCAGTAPRTKEGEGDFAGHSLRAGFATEAFRRGVAELLVMRYGRWKTSSAMRGVHPLGAGC
jgi:hypothetical protein